MKLDYTKMYGSPLLKASNLHEAHRRTARAEARLGRSKRKNRKEKNDA
jgi:hypothetical protein